ncbi:ABC transporter permease [Actinokineospora globicatena]|uniref:Transport permease protein n=1 Tax=Actinokineospora globicatena TaxID=103729 RepID=A0A9W6VAG3_9PSEU|nr:ABC transporter permease [Actinokineospora globicatena]MCP2300752.1 ABC-2 type transport system permease protein [Actinokineospora globicatena]GLW77623.1 transport permease protein [Actinokineospora globicatena]GLW84459.1 transport permease protein [Actinokineospora globicatena]GLW92959.1 transport permease protein [Actinokineospora globicatena]
MTTTTARPRPQARPAAPLPSTLANGLARGAAEVKMFFRSKEAVIFTFSFPAFVLLLLGSIFDTGEAMPGGASMSQVFAASMIAYGILNTAFTSVGVGIAADREDGTLKRLRGTPITASAYFIGKIILVAVATVAEVALLLAVGVVAFGLELPTAPSTWLTFGWILLLSVIACTLVGIAASGLAKSGKNAATVLNLPVIALQFTSGVFVAISSLPDVMVKVAAFFPVRWMGQGFRSVLLPDSMAVGEVAGSWELPVVALVLGAWCVVGLLLCLLTFRWTERKAG